VQIFVLKIKGVIIYGGVKLWGFLLKWLVTLTTTLRYVTAQLATPVCFEYLYMYL